MPLRPSRGWVTLVLYAALGRSGEAAAYEVNGRLWPSMPIPYTVNVASAPAFPGGAAEALARALAELGRRAGTQFCPRCVDAATAVAERDTPGYMLARLTGYVARGNER